MVLDEFEVNDEVVGPSTVIDPYGELKCCFSKFFKTLYRLISVIFLIQHNIPPDSFDESQKEEIISLSFYSL